jgi:hypothetical protein
MAREFENAPPPPMDGPQRARTPRSRRIGWALVCLGVLAVLVGARIIRDFNGAPAHEWNLIQAATTGGLNSETPLASSNRPATQAGSQPSSAPKPGSQGEVPPCPT